MPILSPRLRRLDGALADLPPESDAMLLGQLDGYVAGLIVGPVPLAPEDWLPLVWGDGDPALSFADADEAAWYSQLVLDHYQAIVRSLAKGPGRYTPFFEIDPINRDILWEMWIEGYDAAIALQGELAGATDDSQEPDAAAARAAIDTLSQIARDASDLPRDEIDRLTESAPRLIPVWIDGLYRARRAHEPVSAAPATPLPQARIGRNDPCPCGSGAKYKKCCARG